MRNLKRALSLALASVMLMGMMVVGTSAAYNDVDTADNIEAIEVLQAVGIMKGDENGNFNPDALLTRQEMAVVMSNLMDYRVASYAGTCPFGDVADWAEPYVAACYTNGITSGMSAGYYGATEYVTTAQAALMLMKALGYFQFQSDFENDWMLATVKQANKIELFDDVESGVKEAMTRNDLAQLVLNTLESGLVEASDDTIKVNTGDVSVEAGKVNYIYVTSGKAYASAISSLRPTSATSSTVGAIVELGEKLYEGNLKKYADVFDDMGRPSDEWVYKTTNIGTFGKQTAAVYTAKMSKDALYELCGKNVIENYGLIHFVDGDLQNSTAADGTIVLKNLKTDGFVLANSTSASANSGNGVVTEVYIDADAQLVVIVTINTYLMQATADYNASKETVAVTTITGAATDANLSADDFAAVAELAEDDYILYTIDLDDNSIQTIAKADVVTGKVDAYSFSEWVTIDGTKYKHNAKVETVSDNTSYVVTDTAAIVVDKYGYLVYVDDASVSVGNYVYIVATAQESSLSTKDIGDAYFADGTNATIVIKDRFAANGTTPIAVPTGYAADGSWYSYIKDSKGEYTLTKAATDGNASSSVTSIKNNKVVLFDSVVGNKNTIFVVVDKNDNINVYTGIANVPDVTLGTGSQIGYFLDKDTAGKAAAVVFVDAGTGTVKGNTTESMIYVLKNDSQYVDTMDNETVYVKVISLDGVETKVETKENWAVGTMFDDYLINKDGYYEATGNEWAWDDDDLGWEVTGATLTHSGNTFKVTGTLSAPAPTVVPTVVVNDDTVIHMVMLPAKSGSTDLSDKLASEIMTDNAAKYEFSPNMTAKTLAAKFDGYTIDGRVRIVYDDRSESDLATAIFVEVTAAHTAP